MARKARKIQDTSSDDDSPEVVSYSTSKADAKRDQKALHDFEAEEKARRKARNRERDQKLKERARVTKGEKTGKKVKEVQFLEGESEGDSGEDEGADDDVEARMLRAMRDAADEVENVDDEFEGIGQKMDLASGLDSSSEHDEDHEMSDSETTPFQGNILRSNRKTDYLADDLFAAAFASQNSKPVPKKETESTEQQTIKKRRRKYIAHPKDLVVGYVMSPQAQVVSLSSRFSGRTIRTLPRLSDPRSQATARSVPSARARKFMDHSLAMKGKNALLNAKKRGWERRPGKSTSFFCPTHVA